MKKYYLFILFLISFNLVSAQLSPQSKKITEKFFKEYEELENITPALKKKKGYTNYKELIEFLNNISTTHPDKISLKYIGESAKGKKIPIMFLSNNSLNQQKLNIWMQGGLHGDEPAGTEAMLYLIHTLLNDSKYTYLLDKIDLAILPMANIDGFLKNNRYAANGLDLNRDHTKLMAIETRLIKDAFVQFNPDVALDFHEYRPYRKDFAQLSTFGICSAYDVMFHNSSNLNIPENIRIMIDTLFTKNAKDELDKINLRHRNYMKSEKISGEIHFSQGTTTARSSSNSFALNNVFASLFEIRGVGIAKTSFKRRVNSGLTLALSYLKTSYNNTDLIKEQIEIANGMSNEIIVKIDKSMYSDKIQVIDIDTNELIELDVMMRDAKKPIVKLKRVRPQGYIIKKEYSLIISKLKNLGIEMSQIQNDTVIDINKYLIKDYNDNFLVYEKMKLQEVKSELVDDVIQFSKGDYIIYMKQRRSNLIAELMEPEAPNSFVSFGLIKTSIDDVLPIFRLKK